jgi:hypothetical protein
MVSNKPIDDAAAEVIHALLMTASKHQVCPACLAILCADIFHNAADQFPHIEDGEAFTIEKLDIHKTVGNA